MARLLLGWAALAGCGADLEVLTAARAGAPLPGGCGLAAPAFCDPLSSAHPGGRGGDLDEALWSVARLSTRINPPQGMLQEWTPSNALFCGERNQAVLPPGDFRVCGGRLEETADDGTSEGSLSGETLHSMRIRQPFDFGGEGAVVAFEVDAKAERGLVWVEVWITDEPVPAPFRPVDALAPLPRNGIGLRLDGECASAAATALDEMTLVRDRTMTASPGVQDPVCFATADGTLNHFQLRVRPTRVELWATDLDQPQTLRRVGWREVNLPFSVGYVSFAHVQNQAGKFTDRSAATYRWRNIGFDGPVHPTPKVAEVPDLLAPDGLGVNLGYLLDPERGGTRTFTLPGVSLAGARSARLNFNIQGFDPGTLLRWRLNGGAWQDHPYAYADPANLARTESAVVPLGALRDGDNTLELAAERAPAFGAVLSNLDLTVSAEP